VKIRHAVAVLALMAAAAGGFFAAPLVYRAGGDAAPAAAVSDPSGYGVTRRVVEHPENRGRANCAVNPGDFGPPQESCQGLKSLSLLNTSRRNIGDVWVSVEEDELSYPPDTILKAIFSNPDLSDMAKASYLFRYMTLATYHFTPSTYDNAAPFKALKSYGYGWCTDLGWAFGALAERFGGIPARMTNADEHDAIELLIDGEWRLFDIDMRSWLTDNSYVPISVKRFKEMPDARIPLAKQRSSPGLEHAKDLVNRIYAVTDKKFSEGGVPMGLVNTQDIELSLPPLHEFTLFYDKDNTAYAGLLAPEAADSIGRGVYELDFKRLVSAEDANAALVLNPALFEVKDGVVRALTDTYIEYEIGSDYPIIDVAYSGSGEGLCVRLQTWWFQDECRVPQADAAHAFTYSYAALLHDKRLVNAERDQSPMVSRSTVQNMTLRIDVKQGTVLENFKVRTTVQMNPRLFPHLSGGTRSTFVVRHTPAAIAAPRLTAALAENAKAEAMPAPVLNALEIAGGKVSAKFAGPYTGYDWIVTDVHGLPVHPNLMGWARDQSATIAFDLFNERAAGLFLQVRGQARDGTFSTYFEQIPLSVCSGSACPVLKAAPDSRIAAAPLPGLKIPR